MSTRLTVADESMAQQVEPLRTAYREAAAVLSVFRPANLRCFGMDGPPGGAFEQLVDDSVAPYRREGTDAVWTLRLQVRREALASLWSRQLTLQALACNPDREQTRVQQMFEAYLGGNDVNPKTLDAEGLAALLQIVDWLSGIAPTLPDVADIRRRLARTHLLEPFQHMLKDGFFGRESELDQLRNYVGVLPPVTFGGQVKRAIGKFFASQKRAPMIIWGVGGVGKSTLLAKFVYEHAFQGDEVEFPCAYLDFDSGSVGLTRSAAIFVQILAQIAIQYPEHATKISRFRHHYDTFLRLPETDTPSPLKKKPSKVVQSSSRLGKVEQSCLRRLARFVQIILSPDASTGTSKPFLVVFDTFEHLHEFSEGRVRKIGAYIRFFQDLVPTTRVVISGRNNVKSVLATSGLEPEVTELKDLDQIAANAILSTRGINNAEQRSAIYSIAGGNPLSLRLAVQLSIEGNLDASFTARAAALLKRAIGETLIQSYLYDRILNHIDDDAVRQLAHPGLALRYIDPDVILEVLSELCKLGISERSEAVRLFNSLKRYAQLVVPDGEGVRHRQDVRRLMLKSLDQDRPGLVRPLNERAISYFSKKDGEKYRAEEIYHRLRLNQDHQTIESRWIPGVEEWLRGSGPELPLRAQLFLISRRIQADVEGINKSSVQGLDNEMLIASKAQDLLASGLIEDARHMIADVPTRSMNSPLALPEGQIAVMQGQLDMAQQKLDEAERAAIENDQASELESALLLGSDVAYKRGDFITALRIAERAGEVLATSNRQDRHLWALILQYRAVQAQPQDYKDRQAKRLETQSKVVSVLDASPWVARDDKIGCQLLPILAAGVAGHFVDQLRSVIRSGTGFVSEYPISQVVSDWMKKSHENVWLKNKLDRGSSGDTLTEPLIALIEETPELQLDIGARAASSGAIPIFGVQDAPSYSS
jgi:hypothetical protein